MNDSPYYPPRARWHGGLFRFWEKIEHRYYYCETRRSLGHFLNPILPAFIVPGFGLWISGRRSKGRIVFGIYWVFALIFLIELGHVLSGWALGLMIGFHTISTWTYLVAVAPLSQKYWRLVRMGLLVCLYSLIYLIPVRHLMTNYAFLPLTMEGRVCIVNPRVPMDRLQRGDWVAYERPEIRIPGFLLKAGPQLAQVYGLPGDRCSFQNGYFQIYAPAKGGGAVLSKRYPAWPGMPQEGEQTINQNDLFVWPKLINLSKYSGSVLRQFAALEQQFAYANSQVSREEYRGRLYRWWFWRRQVIS